jgi:hypothetical protein
MLEQQFVDVMLDIIPSQTQSQDVGHNVFMTTSVHRFKDVYMANVYLHATQIHVV